MTDPPSSTARDLRVGDRERDAVVEALAAHARAGRLTLAEHEARVERALAARRRSELDALLGDLPGRRGHRPAGTTRPPALPPLAVTAALVALSIAIPVVLVGHPFPPVGLLLVALWWSRRPCA